MYSLGWVSLPASNTLSSSSPPWQDSQSLWAPAGAGEAIVHIAPRDSCKLHGEHCAPMHAIPCCFEEMTPPYRTRSMSSSAYRGPSCFLEPWSATCAFPFSAAPSAVTCSVPLFFSSLARKMPLSMGWAACGKARRVLAREAKMVHGATPLCAWKHPWVGARSFMIPRYFYRSAFFKSVIRHGGPVPLALAMLWFTFARSTAWPDRCGP